MTEAAESSKDPNPVWQHTNTCTCLPGLLPRRTNGCSSRAQTSHANNLQACRHTLGIKPGRSIYLEIQRSTTRAQVLSSDLSKFSAILEALSKARRNGIVLEKNTGLCSPPVSSPRWLGCGSKCPSRSAHRPNEECSCVCSWPLEVAGMTLGSR